MTQIKFVTRILFILHKSLMMPTIPAELPVHSELIQKLLMFVSHMYIVVMHLTAVSSYMYQHDKESHAVIKLQMGITKSREKTTCILKASDMVQEKFL